MKLYSYVVARDYGFAPNPFFGVCTLATCKPKIRARATVGDWIVGVGSAGNRLHGRLVYVMRVDETLSFDQYWEDPRFWMKRPSLRGSLMQAYGDNIYHRDPTTGQWIQADSHHSYDDGATNPWNVERDTSAPRVLVGWRFTYWGCQGPEAPPRFRDDICRGGRPDRCNFRQEHVRDFLSWVSSLDERGYVGRPERLDRVLRGARSGPRRGHSSRRP